MDRRSFICAFTTLLVLAGPLVARAQTVTTVRRIGWLLSGTQLSASELEEEIAPLRELGWIEGRNLLVDGLWTLGFDLRFSSSSAVHWTGLSEIGSLVMLASSLVRLPAFVGDDHRRGDLQRRRLTVVRCIREWIDAGLDELIGTTSKEAT
jgi:hypothetical protein